MTDCSTGFQVKIYPYSTHFMKNRTRSHFEEHYETSLPLIVKLQNIYHSFQGITPEYLRAQSIFFPKMALVPLNLLRTRKKSVQIILPSDVIIALRFVRAEQQNAAAELNG